MFERIQAHLLRPLLGLFTDAVLNGHPWAYPSLQRWVYEPAVVATMLKAPDFVDSLHQALEPLEMIFRSSAANSVQNPSAFQLNMMALHAHQGEGDASIAWWPLMVQIVRSIELQHSLFLIHMSMWPIRPPEVSKTLFEQKLGFTGARGILALVYQIGGAYSGPRDAHPAFVQLFVVATSIPGESGEAHAPSTHGPDLFSSLFARSKSGQGGAGATQYCRTWRRRAQPTTLEDKEKGLTQRGRTTIQDRQRKETRTVEAAADRALDRLGRDLILPDGERIPDEEDDPEDEEAGSAHYDELVLRSCPFPAVRIMYACSAMTASSLLNGSSDESQIISEFRI